MADIPVKIYRTTTVREGTSPTNPSFPADQDPIIENPEGTTDFVPYIDANKDVQLGEFGLETGFVKYDTTPTNIPEDQGTSYWDVDDETVAIVMNGITQKVGEDQFLPVKNMTGSTIPKGSAVGYAGTIGSSGRVLISLFLANGANPSKLFLGVTGEAIPTGGDSKVYTFGRLKGINTSAFTANQVLYCSPTVAGGFTATVPTSPSNIISVAIVINSSATVGSIFIRPQIGSDINEDEGVRIISPTNGQALVYDSVLGLWVNGDNGVQLRTAGDTGIGAIRYSGTTKTDGQIYGGTINPSNNTRLNYDGNFHANESVFNGVNIGRGGGAIATNTRVGSSALLNNTTGFSNTANGLNSLRNNTTGGANTASGRDSLLQNTTGSGNTANGLNSLRNNTTGGNNTASGDDSLLQNTTGFNNTANGHAALEYNTTGSNNTANGYAALYNNTTGGANTANGLNALRNNTTGSDNTASGSDAGRFLADGSTALTIANNSVFLGVDSRANANNQTNQIVIGTTAIGAGSNTATLGNTSIVKTILRGTINAANLPTSSAGLITGDIWNDSGTLKIIS